jgi:hypothetical protein
MERKPAPNIDFAAQRRKRKPRAPDDDSKSDAALDVDRIVEAAETGVGAGSDQAKEAAIEIPERREQDA